MGLFRRRTESRLTYFLVLVLILLLSAALPSHGVPTRAEAMELVRNGGFEEGNGDAPTYWTVVDGSLSRVSSPVSSGSYAGRFSSGGPTTKWLYQVVPVSEGSTYVFSASLLKNDPAVGLAHLRVSWHTSPGGFGSAIAITDSTEQISDDSPSFRGISTGAITAPASARSARLMIALVPTGSDAAQIYVDDVSFDETSVSATTTSTVSPTSTPTFTATRTSTRTSTPTATRTATRTRTPSRGLIKPGIVPGTSTDPTLISVVMPTSTTTQTPVKAGDVTINELQPDPVQSGIDASHEWIELHNRTDRSISLVGWSIADNEGHDSIPAAEIAPQGYLVLASTPRFFDNFPAYSGPIAFVPDGRIGNGLSNTGDRLILRDEAGRVVDALSYGSDSGVFSPPCPAPLPGESLERTNPAQDTDTARDFVVNSSPSPGQVISHVAAAAAGTTPVSPTSVPTGSATPALSATPSATPTPSHTPSPTVTRTWSPTPTASSTASPSPTPSNTPSPTATRTATSTPTVTNTPTPTQTPTFTSSPTPTPSQTPTFTLTPTVTRTPTPTFNFSLYSTHIFLNEILSSPSQKDWNDDGAFDTGDQWIEIFNFDAVTVDLGGWRLQTDSGGSYTIPGGSTIAPQGFRVFFRKDTGLSLGGTSDVVNLYRPDGVFADGFTYQRSNPDESWARTTNGTGAFSITSSPTLGYSNVISLDATPTVPASGTTIDATQTPSTDGTSYTPVPFYFSSGGFYPLGIQETPVAGNGTPLPITTTSSLQTPITTTAGNSQPALEPFAKAATLQAAIPTINSGMGRSVAPLGATASGNKLPVTGDLDPIVPILAFAVLCAGLVVAVMARRQGGRKG